MKKILFALFTFSLLLSGCAQKIEDPAEASAAYPWIIATDSPKDTVTGLFAHKFAEEVEWLRMAPSICRCMKTVRWEVTVS